MGYRNCMVMSRMEKLMFLSIPFMLDFDQWTGSGAARTAKVSR